MIRVHIDFDTKSPFLRSMSGILTIEDVDFANPVKKHKKILKCRIAKHEGSISYKCMKKQGMPTKLFNGVKPILDLMIRAYFDGMNLSNTSYNWIDIDSEDSIQNRLNKFSNAISEIERPIHNISFKVIDE